MLAYPPLAYPPLPYQLESVLALQLEALLIESPNQPCFLTAQQGPLCSLPQSCALPAGTRKPSCGTGFAELASRWLRRPSPPRLHAQTRIMHCCNAEAVRYRFCRLGCTQVAPPFLAPTICTDTDHAQLSLITISWSWALPAGTLRA